MICSISTTDSRSNGTSVLADEGWRKTLNERSPLPLLDPAIGPKEVPYVATLNLKSLTPRVVEEMQACNLVGWE